MHNNSQKRIWGDYIYFITNNVGNRYPYFKNEILADSWIEILKIAKLKFDFILYAFCLNYNHFHLLIKPNNKKGNYSKIIHFIKKNSSQNINKILGFVPTNYSKSKYFSQISENNNMQPNTMMFNAIKDLNIFVEKQHQQFIHNNGKSHNIPKFYWQKSFHDHIIRSEDDFEKHMNYTMYNFIKHKLPENWKYTSLNYNEIINVSE